MRGHALWDFGTWAAGRKAAGGVNTTTRAKVNASGHYNLLPLRYENSRGLHLGRRQFFCFKARRRLSVFRAPYLGT